MEASLIKANLQDVDLQDADLNKTILFKALSAKLHNQAQLCLTSLLLYNVQPRLIELDPKAWSSTSYQLA